MKKNVIVLGGGGFIGGHLAKRLKDEGSFVRIADIKNHEFWNHDEICHEFIKCDLSKKGKWEQQGQIITKSIVIGDSAGLRILNAKC